jgi:sn-glycerol 3-phosphate transport system ATP-binding protein
LAEVRLENVTKSWSGDPVVDNVTFSARSGQFAVLLGPSGCGKSTTLRLIAGLDNVDTGTISIGGRDVTSLPPARRRVAMVFQSYALFPHLNVAENIVFGLKVRRLPRREREERLKRAAAVLGLQGLLDRKPAQLSGGQQQRVALGRAIVAEAAVCLMDEPLSNLDAQLRGDMRREIRALQRRLGMTVVYVTHDQLEAMTMADQVLLMRAGRIEQAGTPAEVYSAPATMFAARFIGTPPMNVLPARSVAAAARTLLFEPPRGASVDGLAIGVRPEDVRVCPQGIPARVVAAEYLGADTVIDGRIADEPFLIRLPGRCAAAPGDTLEIVWEKAATHWFDPSSGRRIY